MLRRGATRASLALVAILSTTAIHPASAERAMSPERVERELMRAERLLAAGREGPAKRALERVAARAPEDPRAPLRLAELVVPPTATEAAARPTETLKRDAQALAETLARTLDALPSPPPSPEATRAQRQLSFMHAWAVAVAGDHRDALDRTARASGRLDDEALAALRRLATLAILRGDLWAADRALTFALRTGAGDSPLLAELASVKLARGLPTEAIALLKRARRRAPEDLGLRRDLAGALLAAGRGSEALVILSSIAEERPADGEAHLSLATAALLAGDAGRAIASARAANARLPGTDARALVILGMALSREGQPEGARRAFERALTRDPDNARAREALRGLGASEPE